MEVRTFKVSLRGAAKYGASLALRLLLGASVVVYVLPRLQGAADAPDLPEMIRRLSFWGPVCVVASAAAMAALSRMVSVRLSAMGIHGHSPILGRKKFIRYEEVLRVQYFEGGGFPQLRLFDRDGGMVLASAWIDDPAPLQNFLGQHVRPGNPYAAWWHARKVA